MTTVSEHHFEVLLPPPPPPSPPPPRFFFVYISESNWKHVQCVKQHETKQKQAIQKREQGSKVRPRFSSCLYFAVSFDFLFDFDQTICFMCRLHKMHSEKCFEHEHTRTRKKHILFFLFGSTRKKKSCNLYKSKAADCLF